MSTYENICLQLNTCARWQVTLYSICCAERTAPIIRRVGSEKARSQLPKLSDFLWSVHSRSDAKAEASQWSRSICKTPDARCDDSYVALYVSGTALAAYWHALRAICSASPVSDASDLCYHMADITRALDSSDTMLADPPAGPLETVEFGAQQESLTLMGSLEAPTRELVSELRHRVAVASAHYERTIEEECARRGWMEADCSPGIAQPHLAANRFSVQPATGSSATSRVDEAIAAIGRQSRPQVIAYCAYCAELVAPVIGQLGSAQGRALLNSALDLIWRAALQSDAPTQAADIITDLHNTPDMFCEDSQSPLMESHRAFYVIEYALESIHQSDPITYAKQAFIHVLTVRRSIDEAADLSEEVGEHLSVLNLLSCQGTSIAELQPEPRAKAAIDSARFDEALRRLRHRRGWA